MYDNIGGKIKGLAKASFIVEAIAAVITGIALWVDTEEWWCSLILFCGPIVAWVSSWLLYGFGELIDKVSNIERNTRGEANETASNLMVKDEVVEPTPKEIVIKKCDFCGKENANGAHCKIVDDLGTRFRDLCYDCIEENKANISIK